MPNLKYTFKPKARQDVLDTAIYSAQENPMAGQAFLSAVKKSCESISRLPAIGSRRAYNSSLLANIRMLPVYKFEHYLIFYQVVQSGVEVIRVIHAARDIANMFKK